MSDADEERGPPLVEVVIQASPPSQRASALSRPTVPDAGPMAM